MARKFFGRTFLLVLASLVLLPAMAQAQSVFTGTVKDTSGAVMPGVTVEAASPVLIEKVKSAITDENGVYRIVDLRPGTYNLTFTLPGFNTVTRDGIELQSQLHRDHQRRAERRHAAGIGHGVRRLAGGRRAEQRQAAGADARSARRGADGEDHSGPWPAGGRRHAERARRRRLARHAADLLRGARHRRRAVGGAGRRHDDQRPDGRRRRAGVPQRSDVAGNGLPDRRRLGRDHDRRHQHEPGAEGRRQPVPRRRQVGQVARAVAGRQPDRRPPRPGRHRRRQDRALRGVQRRARRPDRQEQAVVLRRVPPVVLRQADRQHLRRPTAACRIRRPTRPARHRRL